MRSEWVTPDARGHKVQARAFAKINLCLHVTGQRDDGYHLLDSLVAFADFGDTIEIRASDHLSLVIDGPMAAGIPADRRNLVLQAARFLDPARGAAIYLTKRLPVAAGIGGGSADAAATLRALSAHWGLPVPDDLSPLGADVPVCWSAVPKRMQGVGNKLTAVPPLPDMWLVLVNTGVVVPTPEVFSALQKKENSAMPEKIPQFRSAQELAHWLGNQRNDLQAPAQAIYPEIGKALAAMGDALLARMSGSGGTCFGVFADAAGASQAARRIAAENPGWWIVDCPVLSAGPL